MTDDINKTIRYRPDISPKRHYESDAIFKSPEPIIPDPLPPVSVPAPKSDVDSLLADLKTVYNLLPYFPIPIRPIVEQIIVTITTDTMIRIQPPDPDETPRPPIPEDPDKFRPITPPVPEIKPPKSEEPIIPKDDDFGFPNIPIIDVKQEDSEKIDRLVYRWTKGNLVRIKKHWIEKLKDYLQDYLSKMFHAVQLCGAEDITVLLLVFDGIAVTTLSGNKCKVAHDTIIRNDLLIREKSKLMEKIYGADQLIRFMRAIEVAAQTRQEYYNHEFQSYCPTLLSQYENDLLREQRAAYDTKYVNAIYQYNKLLTSSADVIKDVFDLTVHNAFSKGILINNGINPFDRTPTPDPIFYINTLAPEPGKINDKGMYDTGNYGKSSSTTNTIDSNKKAADDKDKEEKKDKDDNSKETDNKDTKDDKAKEENKEADKDFSKDKKDDTENKP